MELSVIIPAYNEERRICSYLRDVQAYLEKKGIQYEIIIVDDGSTDRTTEVTKAFVTGNPRTRLVRLSQNQGKGFAVRTGMLQAFGNVRLFADADGATPIIELERLLQAINCGADVAIASRALRDDSCTVKAHLHRKFLGTIYNLLVRFFAVRGIADTQCGFKLFTKESAEVVFPLQRIYDFGFDVELLYICQKNGLKIVEVPVNWKEIGGSKVKIIKDSVRMFIDILRIRVNSLRNLYQLHR